MNVKGIFNLVNSGCCTMSDFAYAVVRLYEKASGRNLNFRLNELSYNDYISAAEPVLYNIISTQKITSELKIELRPWLQALEAFISENWQYL